MEEDLQKADRVQLIGLMEISASMETTRIRDSLVSLGGGWNGVAGTRGRGKVWLWPSVLCAAVNSGASRGQRVQCIARMWRRILRSGMISAKRAITACWGGPQLIEKTTV